MRRGPGPPLQSVRIGSNVIDGWRAIDAQSLGPLRKRLFRPPPWEGIPNRLAIDKSWLVA